MQISQVQKDQLLQMHSLEALLHTQLLSTGNQLGHEVFDKLMATFRILRPVFEGLIESFPDKINTVTGGLLRRYALVDPALLSLNRPVGSAGPDSGSDSDEVPIGRGSDRHIMGERVEEDREDDGGEDSDDRSDKGESDEDSPEEAGGDDRGSTGNAAQARPRTRAQLRSGDVTSIKTVQSTAHAKATKDNRVSTNLTGAERVSNHTMQILCSAHKYIPQVRKMSCQQHCTLSRAPRLRRKLLRM